MILLQSWYRDLLHLEVLHLIYLTYFIGKTLRHAARAASAASRSAPVPFLGKMLILKIFIYRIKLRGALCKIPVQADAVWIISLAMNGISQVKMIHWKSCFIFYLSFLFFA